MLTSLVLKARQFAYRSPTIRPEISKLVHYLTALPLVRSVHQSRALRRIGAMQGQPPGMYIETTDYCNAECVTCPYPTLERPKDVMSMDLFRKIADEAIAYGVRSYSLFFLGEPLIDKLLFDRIRYLKEKCPDCRTWINTNGSLLTEEKCHRLIDSGLDVLFLSMDGTNKETFEKIRVGLSYDKVIANLERMVAIRRARGAMKPSLNLYFVEVDANRSERRAVYDRWKDKVDGVAIVNAHNWATQANVTSQASPQLNHAYPRMNPCIYLWNLLVVLADGRVALCCMDSDGKVILGDLKAQSLAEVWSGEGFESYRRAHLEGRRGEVELCSACTKFTLWW